MTRPNHVTAIALGVLAVVFVMLLPIQSASADWVYCVQRYFPPGKSCTTLPGENPLLGSAPTTSGGAGGGSATTAPKPIKSMGKKKIEGNCPPGQTDQLEAYKGTCMDPKLIDPQTKKLKKEVSRCPDGQTDQLKAYKGICMDPKLIDPQTGRLKEASRCPAGQTDQLKAYKGICVDPKLVAH